MKKGGGGPGKAYSSHQGGAGASQIYWIDEELDRQIQRKEPPSSPKGVQNVSHARRNGEGGVLPFENKFY